MRFLADESCDFAVVRALRSGGHEVLAVSEIARGADDEAVISLAAEERAVLLTEDTDFGRLFFVAMRQSAGVVLIRFTQPARLSLGAAAVRLVAQVGEALSGSFVVLQPGRARISRRSI